MASKYFRKVAHKVTDEAKRFTTNSLDIIEQVHYLLKQEGMTQKDLAEKMGKTEPEISKLLSPAYSMTLLTISKIEAALGSDIIITPLKAHQRFENEILRSIYHQTKRIETSGHQAPSDIGYGTEIPMSVKSFKVQV